MATRTKPVRAAKGEIDEFLRDFCGSYRANLATAYKLIGDEPEDQPSGTFVIPKMVLQITAEKFNLPSDLIKRNGDIWDQLISQI